MITVDFLFHEFMPAFLFGFWGIGLFFVIVGWFLFKFVLIPFGKEVDDDFKKRKQRDKDLDDLIVKVDNLSEIVIKNSEVIDDVD